MSIHPKIKEIASHFGVKLSERNCADGYVFDGESIAMFRKRYDPKFPDLDIEIEIPLSDHEILHEIAHFIVANPEQKDLPEYGLGYVQKGFNKYVDEVVDKSERYIQEFMAQLLCCKWGQAYGVNFHFSTENFSHTWDSYLLYKINESIALLQTPEYMWEALIRLENKRLLFSLPVPENNYHKGR